MACFHSSEMGAFCGGEEAGTEVDADRAQHERRREAAPVENAAGGDHGDRSHGVNDLWDQCHGTDIAAITAGLSALRDDHVDTRGRPPGSPAQPS